MNESNVTANLAVRVAEQLNNDVFDARHAILKNNFNDLQIIKYLNENKKFMCFAVSISKDVKMMVVSANVKTFTNPERKRGSKFNEIEGKWENRRVVKCENKDYGILEHDKETIYKSVRENFPELRMTEIEVIGVIGEPLTKKTNAENHAEMQHLAYGITSNWVMGVSKPACHNCDQMLKEKGIKFSEPVGYKNKNPKNWKDPKDISIEKKFSFPSSENGITSSLNR